MSEPKFVVCSCNVCSGSLEFDASQAGTTIQCPHCGMDTILFVPAKPVEVSEPPTKQPRRKPNVSWKRKAVSLIALFAIVAFVIYQWQKSEQESQRSQKELEAIVNPTPPTRETLQTNALNKMLEDCSNNVVGLQRIVKSYVEPQGSPSNWFGMATVEFINKVGGYERVDKWYDFDAIPNEAGRTMAIFAYEDLDHEFADELGNADAQYKMGIRYLNGHQAWKDVDMAKKYFQKAAAQGNQDAISALNHLPP